jgi:ketosteroid isomerase-like protein
MVEEHQTPAPPEIVALAAKGMATPPSEQQARQPDARIATAPTPTRSDGSLRSRSERPLDLPKPPRTIDTQTVARLDAVYQAAVKANDIAIMDEILGDDFVLLTDRGVSLTKADLIKEAQEKRTIYEHQEVEEGTQKVRIWRDTAVVTALLRIKGTRDQNPFDYKVWLSETYVRTPTGWHYVFGQALRPDAK